MTGNGRAYMLRYKYRITLEDYADMLTAQNGVCAICEGPARAVGRAGAVLCVDHDHRCCPRVPTCGRCIRGLLCWDCNHLLDRVERGVEAATAAQVNYLTRTQIPLC